MRQIGRKVKTQSYSLPFDMIEWVQNYGYKTRRTQSQVIQMAVEFLINKVNNKDIVIE